MTFFMLYNIKKHDNYHIISRQLTISLFHHSIQNDIKLSQMKITLATIKSFVKNNEKNLYINVKSSFDGMCDCVMPENNGFTPIEKRKNGVFIDTDIDKRTLNIKGAWFVGSSRDYFTAFENPIFKGFNISNSCGSFILAVKK